MDSMQVLVYSVEGVFRCWGIAWRGCANVGVQRGGLYRCRDELNEKGEQQGLSQG